MIVCATGYNLFVANDGHEYATTPTLCAFFVDCRWHQTVFQ